MSSCKYPIYLKGRTYAFDGKVKSHVLLDWFDNMEYILDYYGFIGRECVFYAKNYLGVFDKDLILNF